MERIFKQNYNYNHQNRILKYYFREKEMVLFLSVLTIVFLCGCSSSSHYQQVNGYSKSTASRSMEQEVFDFDEPDLSYPTSSVAHEDVIHIVTKGDTLYGISKKYNVPVHEIAKLNNIHGNKIVVGEKLIISRLKAAAADQFSKVFDFSEELEEYKVSKGDTIGKIAAKYGVSVGRIVEVNNIKNPNRIKLGQRLLIPKN